ncbi:Gfo/Idh/MocA family protein [Pontivivens insulae]|uniref:Glucose--fructose oxidoreductase n=1 Tax=Pontivivens insulae TaxID=1639689 RepID=A0A2R8ADL2_9RHOB|nr:Gfo/Idh/MocA family oxidoreductase [Pontivivens insulae]RED14252.1 putative dehydrogenase [Pontivivens insulae]SPF30327.1 Glucose--fructose oxidoreductase [Pontivivens insulae]
MTQSIVRWGILGLAKIALDQVIPAIHLSQRGTVAAVASLSGKRLSGYGDVRHHDSYEALLADAEVDAIYIPLPNNMHVEWTEKALRAGKHVLCEKPLAWNVAGIDRLIAAEAETGKLAAEAFMVAHHPQWDHVAGLIAQGAIGQLAHIEGVFTYFNDDAGNIRNQAALEGGALGDIGVYPVITARLATGQEPLRASARAVMQDGVDLTTHALLDFDGFTMSFYCSMRMIRHQFMRFHGTDGVIEVPTPFNPPDYDAARVILRRRDESIEQRFPTAMQYVAQADAFHASVLDNAPYPFPLSASRANQSVLDMIRESAAG